MLPLVIMWGKDGAQDTLSAILNHTESGFFSEIKIISSENQYPKTFTDKS